MKHIKILSAVMFALIMGKVLSFAFGGYELPITAILLIGTAIVSKGMDLRGSFGEFLVIDATDSPETKKAKETFNQLHDTIVEKGKADKTELKSLFETESRKLIDQNSELKESLRVITEEKAAMDAKIGEHEAAILEINRTRAANTAAGEKGVSFKSAFDTAMDENMDDIKAFAQGRLKNANKVRMELKAVGDMGLSSISNLTAANVQVAPGIVPFPSRKVHLRDIMSTGRMTTSLYNYLKEIGFDGSIGTWQENSGAKPQFDIRYQEASAEAEFVAGWIRISRKSLDDIPALKSNLAFRLLQKYLDAEDNQILNGTGANGQLQGFYKAGNSIAYSGGKTKSVEMLVDSISQLEVLNHTATGILMDPIGYNNVLLSQSTGNTNGIYSLPGGLVSYGGSGTGLEVAGTQSYKTTAQSANKFLTGDWTMGAQLLFREDPIVEFFEQDGDNVKNNQITVRVEGRVANVIYYNDAFQYGTFVNPGS